MGVAKVILNEEVLMDVTQKTVTSSNLLSGYTALGADGENVVGSLTPAGDYQSKTVTPTEQVQTVVPDQGYDALSQVTVNAIPSSYIIPTGCLDIASAGVTYVSQYEAVNVPSAQYAPVMLNTQISSTGASPYFKVFGETVIATAGYVESGTYSSVISINGFIPASSYSGMVTQTLQTSGKYVFSNIRINSPSLAPLDVTPTLAKQTFTPQSPTDAYSKVTVNAAQLEPLTVTLSTASQTISPTSPAIGFRSVSVPAVALSSLSVTPTNAPQEFTPQSPFMGYSAVTVFPAYTTDLSVTPSTVQSVYYPTSPYVGFSKVTANPIPSSYIVPAGTLSVLQNGSFDVASYASVNVSVPIGEGSYKDLVCAMVQRTSYGLSIDSNLSLELSSTSIGAGAFMGQYGFSTITISGPKTIGMSAFAFVHASVINVPDAEEILGSAFYRCDAVSLSFPKCSFLGGSYTFASCSMLEYVAFPELLSMSNGGYHFTDCFNLSTVYMPKLTNVQLSAFFRCYGLTNISLPECVSIYSSAFQMCKNLSDVYFPKCEWIYPYAFAASTTNADAFSSSAPRISQLTSSNFPALGSILSSGFYYNTWITNISLSTLTSIYTGAFYNCGNLITLSIPNAVAIGASAFYKVGITSLSLPACHSIYSNAFRNCTSLQTVYISSAWTISSYAFTQCSSLATVSIVGDADGHQLKIETYAFNSCINLMSVYINATSLGSAAASLIFNLTPMKDSSYTGNFGSIYIQNESLYNQILSMSQWSTLLDRVVSAY